MDLKQYIASVPDFPKSGILFRDIMPLLRTHFDATIDAMQALLTAAQWREVEAIAGIESRGFILGAALAVRLGKGFVAIRKQGKLPPPVSRLSYELEYGAATIEMQPGGGRIVIVDDVLATGGTMGASVQLAARSGYDVMTALVLIDLGMVDPPARDGIEVRSALRYG